MDARVPQIRTASCRVPQNCLKHLFFLRSNYTEDSENAQPQEHLGPQKNNFVGNTKRNGWKEDASLTNEKSVTKKSQLWPKRTNNHFLRQMQRKFLGMMICKPETFVLAVWWLKSWQGHRNVSQDTQQSHGHNTREVRKKKSSIKQASFTGGPFAVHRLPKVSDSWNLPFCISGYDFSWDMKNKIHNQRWDWRCLKFKTRTLLVFQRLLHLFWLIM